MKSKTVSDIVKKPYSLLFRVHALRQMLNRKIDEADAGKVVAGGDDHRGIS
jgi:hypothetical protein